MSQWTFACLAVHLQPCLCERLKVYDVDSSVWGCVLLPLRSSQESPQQEGWCEGKPVDRSLFLLFSFCLQTSFYPWLTFHCLDTSNPINITVKMLRADLTLSCATAFTETSMLIYVRDMRIAAVLKAPQSVWLSRLWVSASFHFASSRRFVQVSYVHAVVTEEEVSQSQWRPTVERDCKTINTSKLQQDNMMESSFRLLQHLYSHKNFTMR